jgi:HD-like signal output (HDOD) protein
MSIINVSELKPNMVLRDDVRDSKGRFLLLKGTNLTMDQIRMLKMWGVIEADIEGNGHEYTKQEASDYADATSIEIAEKVTSDYFMHTDRDHPAIRELFNACSLRKAIELAQRKTNIAYDDSSRIDSCIAVVPEHLTTEKGVLEYITCDIKLPTLPAVFVTINETIMNPKSSARDIANAISADTSLSARLLKIVNSAFYGFPSQIDTLTRAVAIVGTKQLSILAFGIKIISVFEDISSDIIDMKSFWKHSFACGVISRIIAGYKNIRNTERLFVAGLVHDIGRLILYSYMPAVSLSAIQKAKETSGLLYDMEHEIMNLDHAMIGQMLLKKWKLPFSLEDIVAHHHVPQSSQNQLECSIVHLADIITNAIKIGTSGEYYVPPLDLFSWDRIDISEKVLTSIIQQSDRQFDEIIQLFFSHEN